MRLPLSIETKTGPAVIVGDVGAPGIPVTVRFWGNVLTVISGHKREYGPGGFELRGWPIVDAVFEVEVFGILFQVPVCKAEPWTKITLGTGPPQPPTPPTPPVPTEEFYRVKPGYGVHTGLDMRRWKLLEDYERCSALGLKWVLLVPQDELQLKAALAIFWPRFVPVIRPYALIDRFHDFVRDTLIMLELGVPPYVQLFNEPLDDREWASGKPDWDFFVHRWISAAEAVASVGGWPGLQLLDTNELRKVIRETNRRGLLSLWQKVWFCPHNYGLNHPLRYPYDPVNQLGVPVQHPEFDFVGPLEEVNRWREEGKNPNQTIHEDYNCFLSFLAFAQVFEDELGFVPPMICGEGGWQYGSSQDRRYPIVRDVLHARHHAAMFIVLRTERLPTGEPLPDYLYAFCPWILSGKDADAWVGGALGTKELTLKMVKEVTLG